MLPRGAFLLFPFPCDKITSCTQNSCVITFLNLYLHPFLSMNYEVLLLSVRSSSCAVGAFFFSGVQELLVPVLYIPEPILPFSWQ